MKKLQFWKKKQAEETSRKIKANDSDANAAKQYAVNFQYFFFEKRNYLSPS